MQPNAPELENAGETVYDEIDENLLAPGYENWTDLNRFMQTVLENPELSVEQRVQYIQQAYERTKDKTDILVPRSAADIKEILIYCYAESPKNMPTRRRANCFRCWGGENKARKLKRC